MWAKGTLMLIGFTGLPHPEILRSWGTNLMSALNINLDQQITFSDGNGNTMTQADAEHAAAMAAIMAVVLMLLAMFLPQIIGAILYKSNVTDKKPKIEDGNKTMQYGKFHHGLFGCHENINECLCALCCPTVRYADTHASISGSFWGSLCYFFGLSFIFSIVGTLLPPMVMTQPDPMSATPGEIASYIQHCQILSYLIKFTLQGVAFGLVARKALRTKLGDPNPGAAAATDCLAWALCYPCALTQDSVEVDIAANVSVGCPCSITPGRSGVPQLSAREVAPSDYEKLLGDAVLLEGGR